MTSHSARGAWRSALNASMNSFTGPVVPPSQAAVEPGTALVLGSARTMTESLRDMVPPAHRRLLPVLFDRPAIRESRATCSDCAMCSKGGSPAPGVLSFRPDTKCCTYEPTLPNFLVGAILADTSPEMAEGRRRIRAHIA